MRTEIKGFKRSKTDLRKLCGEFRLHADDEGDAFLLAALVNLWIYKPNDEFDRIVNAAAKKLKAEAARAAGGEK